MSAGQWHQYCYFTITRTYGLRKRVFFDTSHRPNNKERI